MTEVELDTIPEHRPFGEKRWVGEDGITYVTPIAYAQECSFLSEDDPFYAVDATGQAWTFTKVQGKLHKVKSRHW